MADEADHGTPTEADARELRRIIDGRLVRPRYQPIVDVRTCAVLGYEALSRGPAGSELEAAGELFTVAAATAQSAALDRQCLDAAIRGFAAAGALGRLFINLTPAGLFDAGHELAALEALLDACELAPARLVMEITEQAVFQDYDAVRASMAALKSVGVAFAIDDLGAGYSGLRTWSELDPEFIKIDQYFANRVDQDPLKGEFVRAIVEMACATRSAVICEGVETEGEARELLLAGADYVQGYWLTRPAALPQPTVSDEASALLRPRGQFGVDGLTQSLVSGQAAIEPTALVRDVAAKFHLEPMLEALAVVDDQREPLGLVSRRDLLTTLSLPLRTELYGKRPVREMMNGAPLLIDVNLDLAQVLRRVSRARHQVGSDHFIVTQGDRYVGIGRAADLLDQLRLQRAAGERHANPLSSLPTAVPLYEFVDRLMRRQLPFVLCRIDLRGLRPYNDLYGYRRGDGVLRTLCRLLRDEDKQFDFIAHVGADDFVLVSVNREWQPMLERLVVRFGDSLGEHYPSAALAAGCTRVPDRRGGTWEHPLMELRWWALYCGCALRARGEATVDALERLVRAEPAGQLYGYVEADSDRDDAQIIPLSVSDADAGAPRPLRASDSPCR